MQATSLEDCVLLADQVSRVDVDAILKLHKFFEIKNSKRARCDPDAEELTRFYFSDWSPA